MTTEPLGDPFSEDGRGPSGTEVALVTTLQDASADSIAKDAYEARLLKMGFTPQGLAAMANEWRRRIIGK